MPGELTPKQQALELIRAASSILVLTHAHPDGDALGSGLATKLALEKLGKQVTFAVCGNLPEALGFLPSHTTLEQTFTATKEMLVTIDESQAKVGNVSLRRISPTKLMVVITPKEGSLTPANLRIDDGSFRTDLIIALDCSTIERMGELYEENPSLFYEVPMVNIDHHAGNTNFGKVNIVDVTASSTCEMLVSILESLGKETDLIDSEVATCLLTGIITDTGSFQNANTTPKALTVAAQMVAAGGRQQEIIKRIFQTRSLGQLRLWGRALSYIKEEPHHQFAWTILSKADFVAAQADIVDAGGVVDELLKSAAGMRFVILLYERDGEVKGSVRAVLPQVDVAQIAGLFGGGGHTQAAGFTIQDTSLVAAEQMIIQKIREHLGGEPAPESKPRTPREKKVVPAPLD
jgi:phosphoesterase RecJ-like protein